MELLPVNRFLFTLRACVCGLHTMNVDMEPHHQSMWILLQYVHSNLSLFSGKLQNNDWW